MKKILLLLTIGLVFLACSKNEDNPEPPYYNPIEGMWSFYNSEKQIVSTRVFTHDFQTYYTFFNGVVVPESDIQKQWYKFEKRQQDDKEIEVLIYEKDYGRVFSVKADTLFLENGLGVPEKWIKGNKTSLN